MAPSKKRGGQKRGGQKGSGPKPVDPASPSVGPSSNGTTSNSTTNNNSPAPLPASQMSGPAGVTPVANQGDTKATIRQTNSQKPAESLQPSWSRGSLPSKKPTDDRKENDTPRIAAHSTFQSQSPALKPLVADNQTQVHHTGTRSQSATSAFTSSGKMEVAENLITNVQVKELSTSVDRLTLDDTNATQQQAQSELDPPAAAIKSSATPTLTVVPLPFSSGPVEPKPDPLTQNLPGLIEPTTEEGRAEREYNLKFMREALAMGDLALNTNETPVGCVLVYHGKIVAKGMNATNITRNGTRHAELMALSALLSQREPGDVEEVNNHLALDDASWGDVDPKDGHIYPYGQKLHPAPVVARSILSECVLYVTVEPCVMCASLLRQMGIKKVYFGAVNDKFGGTGGVFKIHMNSKPVPKPVDRPYQNGYGPPDVDRIVKGRSTPVPRDEDDGDGGNVERGYFVEGGYLRDEAVSLLRRFYVQENGRAPQPRKKEGRAARLFAMENQVKNGASGTELSDGSMQPDVPMSPETPVDKEVTMEPEVQVDEGKNPAIRNDTSFY